MRKGIAILVLLLLVACSTQAQNKKFDIYQVDPLIKVLKERNYFPDNVDTIRVARRETATVQLVIRSNTDLDDLSAQIKNVSNEEVVLDSSLVRWVGYVKVGRKYNKPSKDLLHSVSNYFPDPLLDDTSMILPQGGVEPLWITVPIPLNTKPGLYKGIIKIKAKTSGVPISRTQSFYIRVYPVKAPSSS